MKKLIIVLLMLLTASSALAKEEHISRRAAMMTALAISTNAYLYSQEGPATYQSRWARSVFFPVAYSVAKGDPELLIAYGISSLMGVALSEVFMKELWISVNEKFDGAVVGVSINY